MSGKRAQAEQRMDANRRASPARKRTFYPNCSYSIEDTPEGVPALVVRPDVPYERLDFPVNDEVMRALKNEWTRRTIAVPASALDTVR